MFLTDQLASQVGTMALVPQVVDAVQGPVLAAGGISDIRGVAAALAPGAAGVQVGSGVSSLPESTISPLHRAALRAACDDSTQLTNVFTGASGALHREPAWCARWTGEAQTRRCSRAVERAPALLRTRAEAAGVADFSPLWSGQAASLARSESAEELTLALWSGALEWMERLFGALPARAPASKVE